MRWSGDGDVATEYEATIGGPYFEEFIPTDFYDRVQMLGVEEFSDAPSEYLLPEDRDDLDTLFGYVVACALEEGHNRDDFDVYAGKAMALMLSIMDRVTAEMEWEGKLCRQ